MKTHVLEYLLNKVADLKAYEIIKKRLQHIYFSVKFVEFSITPFFTEHLRWLLLYNRFLLTLQAKSLQLTFLKTYCTTDVFLHKKELKTEPFSAWCPLKGPNFSFTLLTSLFFSFSSVLNIRNRNIFSRNDRSSHWRCTIRKGFLENFAKFTGKHLCRSLNRFFSEMILTHFWPKVTCYTP